MIVSALKTLLSATALAVVLGANTPAHAQDEKPLAETCPNLTPEDIEGIENYKGQFSENALYARAYCVNVEEAERRMEIQLRGSIGPREEPGPRPQGPPDADPGSLQVLLREQEPDTFAGLWIQHQPTYGVAVAFTRDAAATLAKYTSDPIYMPVERPGPTIIELRATQGRIVNDLIRLGFAWHGAGSNETTGTVEVELSQEAAPIRAAVARGELDLPDYVTGSATAIAALRKTPGAVEVIDSPAGSGAWWVAPPDQQAAGEASWRETTDSLLARLRSLAAGDPLPAPVKRLPEPEPEPDPFSYMDCIRFGREEALALADLPKAGQFGEATVFGDPEEVSCKESGSGLNCDVAPDRKVRVSWAGWEGGFAVSPKGARLSFDGEGLQCTAPQR